MISNYYNFTVNNKDVKLREVSFFEYKNICKKIISDDIKDLNSVFNEIIEVTTKSVSLNCLEKFQCLMLLRNLIYGNNFTFIYEEKKVHTDLSLLVNSVKFNIPDVIVQTDSIVFTFNTPNNFYNDTIDGLIIDCLKHIKIGEKEINCSQFTNDQKKQLLNELPIPIFETYNKIQNQLKDLNVVFYQDVTINIYDGSLLFFLKRVFQDDMMNIYNFEYTCIRNLKLGALDMEKYTYPELKIFLQSLTKEMKDSQKSPNGIDVEQ